MNRIWDFIAENGRSEEATTFENKRLRLVNLTSAAGIFFTFFFGFAYLALVDNLAPALFCFALGLSLTTPPVLIFFKRPVLAKAVFMTILYATGVLLALMFGEEARFDWFVVFMPSLAFILYHKPRPLLYLAYGLSVFLIIHWIYDHLPPIYVDHNFSFYDQFFGACLTMFVFFVVSLFKNETMRSERLTAETNLQLIEKQKLIESQNHDLLDANLQLDKKQKALESLNSELQHFASVASHDMKEPLRTISSFASLLRRRMPDDSDNRELLFFIEDAAKRMSSLLEELICYARAGIENAPLRPVSLDSIFEKVCRNLHQTITSKRAEINSTKLPDVLGHEGLLSQLFQNLIANALKYVGPGVAPVVNIRFLQKDGNILLVFRDNGIGIAPENQVKIFEPFSRLHTRLEYEGNGIGLAACKKIVDQYHGRIWVESDVGIGSAFFVELPGNLLVKTTSEELLLSSLN